MNRHFEAPHGKSESLVWAAGQSVARLSAIWYSRARVNI
jgi:hypothetical protein